MGTGSRVSESANAPRVDVHAHIMPTALFDELPPGLAARWDQDDGIALEVATRGGHAGRAAVPSLRDLDAHRRSQDHRGVDISLVGAWMDMVAAPTDARTQAALCRVINAHLDRETRRGGRDRFLAALPDLDGGAAADVLAQAVEAGAVGGMIGTGSEHTTLARPDLDALWTCGEALGVPLVVHPGTFEPPTRQRDFFLVNLVGNPYETTLAVGALLGAAVPDRFGDLRIVLVHGGGFFPYQYARLDTGFRRWPGMAGRTARPPADHLRWFYYDTVLFDEPPTRYLLDLVGPERVLAGSDCPFTMSDHRPFAEPESLGLDEQETAEVLGGNACRLFSLNLPPPQRRRPSGNRRNMEPRAIATEDAPKVGFSSGTKAPLSQAIVYGDTVYCSGQGPLDPKSHTITTQDFEEQAQLVLENLLRVVEAAGSSKARIIKCNCYVRDMENFPKFNAVYRAFFEDCPRFPARTTVKAAPPREGVQVEVECIAAVGT